MQRQAWIGLFLITLLMFMWTFWMARRPSGSTPVPMVDTTSSSQEAKDSLSTNKVDSASLQARLGRYAPFAFGKDSLIVVENQVARFEFTTKGAALYRHSLKNITGVQGQPITLWSPLQKQAFIFAEGRTLVNSEQLYFTLLHAPRSIAFTEDSVVFRLTIAPDTFIQVSYHIPVDKYHFRHRITFHNLKEKLRNPYLSYILSYETPQTEPATASMRPYCALYYRQADEVESLTPDEDEVQQTVLQGRIRWISAKGQFFCTLLQAQDAFSSATLTSLPFNSLPKYQIELQLPLTDGFTEQQWYLGPTRYTLLRSYGEEYEKQLNLGWSFIRYINTAFIIPVFGFLEKYIPSYGVIIAILALLVKILLSPLTWRSYLLGVKMQVVNELPEVKALEEKYKDQPDKLMIERSLLYRQLGVSPLSGCVPLLLQIPIFFAMTSFFPNAFELRQQKFLWTSDLSSYDNLLSWGVKIPLIGDHLSLFALLTALSTLAYTFVVQQSQTTTPQSLKWLPYLSPIIFFFFLNDYSSALSWYYFVLNLLTIGQTLIMKKFVDKEALARQLREIQRKKQNKAQIAQQRAQMQRWFRRK